MTINFKRGTNVVKIEDLKAGECFKVDNYSVYLMTDTLDMDLINKPNAVNLLTGCIKAFPWKKEVEKVECEVVVNG